MPLVGHLDLGTGVLRRRIGQRCEALLPTGMMGITTRRNVGLDATFRTRRQRRRADVPGIQRRRVGCAERGRDGLQSGFGFLTVVGVIGEGPSDDEQTLLVHGHLRIVILLKAGIRRVFLSGATAGRIG